MIAFQTLIRRTAAVLGAIAAVTATGLATAQSVTLSGTSGNSCTYSQMTVNPSGNVTVACAGSTTATFTLTAPTSLAQNVTTGSEIRVNRSGSSTSDVAVDVNVTGNCSSATSSLNFPAGTLASQNVVVTTGTATSPVTKCNVSIAPGTGGTAGIPASVGVDVVNPDADVTFAFEASSSVATVGPGFMTVAIKRGGGTNGTWNVPVTLSGTLATGGTPLAGTLSALSVTFAPNESRKTLIYTPPAATPATPSLPATMVFSFGTPTGGVPGQGGSPSGNYATHTLTLNGPAIGCPVPETAANDLGGGGKTNLTRLPSGTVYTFTLPALTLGKISGIFKLSETTVTFPLAPWNYEIHINKCKGLVQATPGSGCYASSANKTLFNKVWFIQFTGAYNTAAKLDASGYCYAPPSEGPWYVNIRYNYAGCSTAPCGWHAQWTNWAY